MHSLRPLVSRWQSESIVLQRPIAADSVTSTFERLGSVATQDVLAMYTMLGGMASMDSEYWRLWPLSEIETENAARSDYGVLFADYLIACWCFRLKPVSAQSSAVYLDYFDREPVLVAPSLEDFFVTYAKEPLRVIDPGAMQKSLGRASDA